MNALLLPQLPVQLLDQENRYASLPVPHLGEISLHRLISSAPPSPDFSRFRPFIIFVADAYLGHRWLTCAV